MSEASTMQPTAEEASTHVATCQLDRGASPAVALVEAVASFTGRRPEDLAPLERTVDSDALNDLVRSGRESDAGTEGHLIFTYADCTVTVDSDGTVVLLGEADDDALARDAGL